MDATIIGVKIKYSALVKKRIMNLPLIVTIVGGLLVLFSYYLVLGQQEDAYRKFWLWEDQSVVGLLTVFQILSVVGFFLFMVPWLFGKAPTGGVLGNRKFFSTVLGVFFLASASWAYLAKEGLNGSTAGAVLCSVSLVVSAICAILFLAGAVEEDKPRWNVVLGTLLFGITIVLSDGVAWNAKFLKSTVFRSK